MPSPFSNVGCACLHVASTRMGGTAERRREAPSTARRGHHLTGPQPIRLTTSSSLEQELRLALDVSDLDELDIQLRVLGLEGASATVDVVIQTGMQLDTTHGWTTIATFPRISTAPAVHLRNVRGLLRYVRWKVTSLPVGGSAATFLIHGVARRWGASAQAAADTDAWSQSELTASPQRLWSMPMLKHSAAGASGMPALAKSELTASGSIHVADVTPSYSPLHDQQLFANKLVPVVGHPTQGVTNSYEQAEAVAVAMLEGPPYHHPLEQVITVSYNDRTQPAAASLYPPLTVNQGLNQRTVFRGESLMGRSISVDSGRSFQYLGKIYPPAGWSLVWGDPSIASRNAYDGKYVYIANLAASDIAFPSEGYFYNTNPRFFMDGFCVARFKQGGLVFDKIVCFKHGNCAVSGRPCREWFSS